MNQEERQQLVFSADLLDQAGRHHEMVAAVKDLARLHIDFSKEERNLFSIAFKNLISAVRLAWKALTSAKGTEDQFSAVRNTYSAKVEKEANDVCEEVFALIDTDVLPFATDEENKAFFHKMKADYYRYQAEFHEEERRESIKTKALESYETAMKIGQSLSDFAHNYVYLGVALNFSVFQYEIMHNHEAAIKLAKATFDEGVFRPPSEEDYKDVITILQLLRDNIYLWTAEHNEDGTD